MKNTQLLFKTIIGSTAYGCDVEGSDIDYKGIYAQHPDDLMSFGYKPQYHKTKDEEYFEIQRFLQLASTANPTVIELLWMPDDCVQHITPAFQHVIDHRDMFLTKQCRNSFGGYAIQQIKKSRGLDKKMNWEKNRVTKKDPIDFCYVYHNGQSLSLKYYAEYNGIDLDRCGVSKIPHMRDCYNLFCDESLIFKGMFSDSNSLILSSIPKELSPTCFVVFNKDGYSQHLKDYKSYQTWLKERNKQRYVDFKGHGQKSDGKNLMHCVRILEEGIEIAKNKTITIRRPNADYLRSIRKGEVDLDKLTQDSERKVIELNEAFDNSDLPDKVDKEKVNQLLIEVRHMIKWS